MDIQPSDLNKILLLVRKLYVSVKKYENTGKQVKQLSNAADVCETQLIELLRQNNTDDEQVTALIETHYQKWLTKIEPAMKVKYGEEWIATLENNFLEQHGYNWKTLLVISLLRLEPHNQDAQDDSSAKT